MKKNKPLRGRPPGQTAQGKKMKNKLYQISLACIQKEGYESATLRKISKKAKVSPGLLYKYFPNKSSVIFEFYDELSKKFETQSFQLKQGSWTTRVVETLEMSLKVLQPYRELIHVLTPILIGSSEKNVFSKWNKAARERVEKGFERAVHLSKNKMDENTAQALSKIFYLVHLGVLLFWVLDKTRSQKATRGVVVVFASLLKILSFSLKFSKSKKLIAKIHQLINQGLYG